jgi:hypothetical protein
MSESDKAVTAKDVAQFLGMSVSGASSVMQLMEVFKMVQKIKRKGTYYVLKDVYDDEQIEAMLPPEVVIISRRRRRISRKTPPPIDNGLEEYLSAVRSQPYSDEGLSALSMIGLSQQEATEETTPTRELPEDLGISTLDDLGVDIEVEERKLGAPIRKEAFATVKYLPKGVRLLNSGDARYLKSQLKSLDGYEDVGGFNTIFAKFSALECGRYGNVLYFSMGMNQWDYVKKITIDQSISDFIVLPNTERKRWSSWNQFLIGLKETGVRYAIEEYDKIIDQFMETGHDLVEMTVEDRKANYVRNILRKRIRERGLREQIKASYVDEWVYLERVGHNQFLHK